MPFIENNTGTNKSICGDGYTAVVIPAGKTRKVHQSYIPEALRAGLDLVDGEPVGADSGTSTETSTGTVEINPAVREAVEAIVALNDDADFNAHGKPKAEAVKREMGGESVPAAVIAQVYDEVKGA